MQAVKIDNSSSPKDWRDQSHSLEGYYKLTMDEDEAHVLRVDRVVSSSFFS